MKVGFTGSRHGMTQLQQYKLAATLLNLNATELHHGDCVGADAQAHFIAQSLNLRIVIHPPDDSKLRAYCPDAYEVMPSLPYLQRNRDIVDSTQVLIVGSRGPEVLRSGTWATARYARKQLRQIFLLEEEL